MDAIVYYDRFVRSEQEMHHRSIPSKNKTVDIQKYMQTLHTNVHTNTYVSHYIVQYNALEIQGVKYNTTKHKAIQNTTVQ